AFVAAREQRCSDTAERRSRRKKERLAGNFFFWLLDVGDDLLRRLIDTAAQSGQRQRCAHQFQERPALKRVVPLFGLLRKLALDQFAELRGVDQLFQTAPVFVRTTCGSGWLIARS